MSEWLNPASVLACLASAVALFQAYNARQLRKAQTSSENRATALKELEVVIDRLSAQLKAAWQTADSKDERIEELETRLAACQEAHRALDRREGSADG